MISPMFVLLLPFLFPLYEFSYLPVLSSQKNSQIIQLFNDQSEDSKVLETFYKSKNSTIFESQSYSSIESLFSRNPTKDETGAIVKSADRSAINRVLQNLAADDKLSCEAKVSYLLDFYQQIKQSKKRKQLIEAQVQQLIRQTKQQITRLKGQVNRVQDNRQHLEISRLNDQINQILNKSKYTKQKIETTTADIAPEEIRAAGYEKQIEILSKQNEEIRRIQAISRLKVIQTSSKIKDIQQRILKTINQKSALEASISQTQTNIKSNINRIEVVNNNILIARSRISDLEQDYDKIKIDIQGLEVSQQRSRTQLSVASTKDKIFLDQLRELQKRINKEEPKLVDDNVFYIKVALSNLNKSKTQVQTQSDRQYYQCYQGAKKLMVKSQKVNAYTIKGELLSQYIRKSYGQIIGRQKILKKPEHTFYFVDTSSKLWANNYGSPLLGSNQDSSCSFSNGEKVSGIGTIVTINKNKITITNEDGKPIVLTLGVCSRLQSTSQVPIKGQNIAWSGITVSGANKIMRGSCF